MSLLYSSVMLILRLEQTSRGFLEFLVAHQELHQQGSLRCIHTVMRMLMTDHAHHGSNRFFFLALELFPFGFDSFDEHIEFFARLDLMAQRRTVTLK
jgi:hypothetical protein